MSHNVLEVHNLVKEYGNFRAVDGISFTVPKGKVIGFLGPNGAGKTTTIQMLLGITIPTSGSVHYFGKDFDQHKGECLQRLNFTSAFNSLLGRLTVWENLIVFAHLYGVKEPEKKIKEISSYFQSEEILHKRYWDISSGQKTRANIMKALLNDPELILMDEPTASLDPDVADKMLSLIEELRSKRELTILYTSHDMNEVTRICDEVMFIDHGKIVAHDTPVGLTKRIKHATLQLMFDAEKKTIIQFMEKNNYKHSFANDNTVLIEIEETLIPKIIFGMGKENIWITDIEVKKPSLEDVFLQIARGDTHES